MLTLKEAQARVRVLGYSITPDAKHAKQFALVHRATRLTFYTYDLREAIEFARLEFARTQLARHNGVCHA